MDHVPSTPSELPQNEPCHKIVEKEILFEEDGRRSERKRGEGLPTEGCVQTLQGIC